MKKVLVTFLTVVVLACIILISADSYLQNKVVKHPFKSKNTNIEITVKQGDSINAVIDNLYSEGKINSPTLMKFYIRGKGYDTSNIKPGTITVSSDINISQFVNDLKKDKVDTSVVKVTIPEGYTLSEIGDALQKNGVISKDDFINACKEYKLPEYIKQDPKRKYALEGFLFPDTYNFKKGSSGEDIIDIMIQRFENIMEDIQAKQNVVLSQADYDKTITMASIIEKEVKLKDERAIAASVFYNRLNIGMKLESCATVQYALDTHKDVLSVQDTKVNSPYNTYLYSGLPVGPICNPGRAAIEAAISPAKTDYKYFVLNGIKNDGSHVFAKTYAEHEQNVKKYEK